VRKERSLRVQEALWPDDAVLVGPTGNLKASRPQTTRDGIVGFGIGLILGIVLAFVAEALDTRVRSASEIERALGLPLLARLPRPSRQLRKDNRLVMLDDPYAEHAEAFRVLRTNLDFFNLEHGARAVMLTSAREKEGKSTTAANLAVTLARSGRRVILVDLDLRHPLIHGFFALDRAPGLMDVLVGRANLDDALVEIPLAEPDESGEPGSGWPHVEGGLRVLPAGSAARNVGELVGSRALTELLTELRDCADIVLIDGPPLLGAGDGIALSAKVDALMVIARLNELRRPIMEEVGRLLNNVHAAKLGFVATGGQFDAGYVQSRTIGPAASAGIPG
jgi:Mrp family chromosome partitioning ATPase